MSGGRRTPRVIASVVGGVGNGAEDPYSIPCSRRYSASWSVPHQPDAGDLYWLTHVESRFRLERRRPDGWLYWGDCPRCCHPIDVAVERAAFAGRSSISVELRCNCVAPHAGAGQGRGGCGRSGRITFGSPS